VAKDVGPSDASFLEQHYDVFVVFVHFIQRHEKSKGADELPTLRKQEILGYLISVGNLELDPDRSH